MSNKAIRCAIYTRKSSEEGLDQSFNSLDAQREACHAFITSQRAEGWRPIAATYDDGGFSGGSMARPALQRLLEDIKARKLDTVVVYKVDRLTRSLADFAKIIEILDTHQASFVSVTQQFSTTSSMGRLTLNVLLSFAQFEREVTGERIRDKIAASKRKGIWMGGRVPLGYDLKDRRLIVNSEEASIVREIYRRYLERGCMAKLKAYLERKGVKGKERVDSVGKKTGGSPYSRGALYKILQNRLYLGEIKHKEQVYPGEQAQIVDRPLWDRVQALLAANNQARHDGRRLRAPSLLVGLLHDAEGNRFTPSHTLKNTKHYRYYVSQAVIKDPKGSHSYPVRISAGEIESLVLSKLRSFLLSPQELIEELSLVKSAPTTHAALTAAQRLSQHLGKAAPSESRMLLRQILWRIVIREDQIDLHIMKGMLRNGLLGAGDGKILPSANSKAPGPDDVFRLEVKANVRRLGREMRLLVSSGGSEASTAKVEPALVKAIARAHDWFERLTKAETGGRSAISKDTGLDERYVGRILNCAFLAPDIVEEVLAGRQPAGFRLESMRIAQSMDWTEQFKGFAKVKKYKVLELTSIEHHVTKKFVRSGVKIDKLCHQ